MAQSNGTRSSTSTHLLAGSLAGLVSAVLLQPLDLLKTRLQQQQKHNSRYQTTIVAELKKLTELKDLWRGVLPSTLRTLIGAGLYMTILSNTRQFMFEYKKSHQWHNQEGLLKLSILPKLSAWENLAAGFFVRGFVGWLTMPITVIKARYESNLYNYKSLSEAVRGIYYNEAPVTSVVEGGAVSPQSGSLRHFFAGTGATLARDCPYAGLYVLFYEAFKNEILPAAAGTALLPASMVNSSAAVLAAAMATTITAPFDAIKTRLQLSGPTRTTMVSATKTLLAESGGFRNLFRGLSLRLGRKGLSSGISWCIYEELIKTGVMTPQKKLA